METILENKPGTVFPRRRAFTLVELLVVISIIAVLATFTIVGLKTVTRSRQISTVRAEMQVIETAVENYKAKYGVYPPGNQNNNGIYAPQDRSLLSQLYYELSGTTTTAIGGVNYFVTSDGSSQIKVADVATAYGVDGFINNTKGGGEDAATAKGFLPGISSKQINKSVTNRTITTTMLITSVGGPDDNYQPLNAAALNPFRYVNPGTNNPNGYDLWVQLVINKQTNLICNWSKTVLKNSPLP
jgi:prepilin-type N-terminal cleavage/methylation domain-containing protein